MRIDASPTAATAKRGRRRIAFVSTVLACGVLLGGCASEASIASSPTSAQVTSMSESAIAADSSTTADTISTSATAAETFLQLLSDEQREQVTYAYDDETKITSWSNFPVTFVERAGLKHLNPVTE